MTSTKAETKMILPFLRTRRSTVFTILGVLIAVAVAVVAVVIYREYKTPSREDPNLVVSDATPDDMTPDLAELIGKYPCIASDRCLAHLFGLAKFSERWDGDVDLATCPNLIPDKLKKCGVPDGSVGLSSAMDFCLGLKQIDEAVGDTCKIQVLKSL